MDSINLSEAFQKKVQAVDTASYKHIRAQLFYHMPDQPGILNEFIWTDYDHINTGLDKLVLIRAALENPSIAGQLLQYMDAEMKDIAADQKAELERVAMSRYAGVDGHEEVSFAELHKIMERLDRKLEASLDFVKNADRILRLNFNKGSAAAHIGQLEFSPETRYFERIKPFLISWIKNMDGPLHSVDMDVRSLTGEDELDVAMKQVQKPPRLIAPKEIIRPQPVRVLH